MDERCDGGLFGSPADMEDSSVDIELELPRDGCAELTVTEAESLLREFGAFITQMSLHVTDRDFEDVVRWAGMIVALVDPKSHLHRLALHLVAGHYIDSERRYALAPSETAIAK